MHLYLILLLSIALVAAFYISGVVFREAEDVTGSIEAVSYTHLTLPTIYSV